MEITSISDYLAGPTAIALVKQDANEAAKVLFDFAKDAPALQVKGALVDKEVYDKDKIEAFSKLPGKKQLIAMIASTINAPVQKLAATLQAYVDKMSEGGDTPAAAE
jgi:large subunit ribosomal protein L10